MSDDSDGILSLCLNWKRDWDRRGRESLPPYWVRVKAPKVEEDVLAKLNEIENRMGSDDAKEADAKGAFLDDDSAVSTSADLNSAMRARISAKGIQEVYREDDVKSHKKLLLDYLQSTQPSPNASTAGFWFCCAATAFQAPQGGLWSFSIPSEVLNLARHPTVPCGIMVLLDTMTDSEVPVWRAPHSDKSELFERHVKFTEQSRQLAEEARLPPAEREAARQRRLQKESIDFHNDFRRKTYAQEQRREAQVVEAIQSQKLPIHVVAEANLEFLKGKLGLVSAPTLPCLLEQILFGMLQDRAFTMRLSVMLDLWKSWAQSGGMTKSHYLAVKEDQVAFALASCVLASMANMVTEPMGSVVGDLQECLRMWKKVRLG